MDTNTYNTRSGSEKDEFPTLLLYTKSLFLLPRPVLISNELNESNIFYNTIPQNSTLYDFYFMKKLNNVYLVFIGI